MVTSLLMDALVIFVTGLGVVFLFLLTLTFLTLGLTRLLPENEAVVSKQASRPSQAGVKPLISSSQSLTITQKAAVVAAVRQYQANS